MEMILDPTIMFFCLGVLAVWVKSNIEIPPDIVKFLSYYLLLAIGFKGGISLAKTQLTVEIFWILLVGVIAAVIIPMWMFFVLKRKLDVQNAAAAAACYGSVSAVTFLTASSWIENQGGAFSGYMVALMALVECPAIMIALIFPKIFRDKEESSSIRFNLKETLHDAFFNGSVFILIGSLLIGYFMNPAKAHDYQIFIYDIFKGFLCFFLFDLGMMAARQVKQLKSNAAFLGIIAIISPLINASLGLLVAKAMGMNVNDGFILMVIIGSASYIAVPAAIKTNLPKASASIYLTMSLGITFPFNILLGLPIYWKLANLFLASA